MPEPVNIARLIPDVAARMPDKRAIVCPEGRDSAGRRAYAHLTFAQLNAETNRIARGLVEMGIGRGCRTVLMVRPSLEFIPLTFALFKVGAVPILVDPGMGRKNFLKCVAQVEPEGFIGVSLAHALRTAFPGAFKSVRYPVTIGRRWFWGGATLDELRDHDASPFELADTTSDETAAILFTTGSTGPAKGVVYSHGVFDAQVNIIRDEWQVGENDIDLPVFPLFALFSTGLGATVVIPDMDPTRPAHVDPNPIIEALEDHGVTYSFGSPTFWRRIAAHCVASGKRLTSLRKVFMAGAPVPADLVEQMSGILRDDADVVIPYGATESLPVSWVTGREIRSGAGERSLEGAGTCVGRPVQVNTVQIIRITDEPIANLSESETLPDGEIGEICVRGPVVTKQYFNLDAATAGAKMLDGDVIWHRMGDLGYLDESGRIWYCGRKAHRVETADGTRYSVRCEAIFNTHDAVMRSALVGLGTRGSQRPIIIIEREDGVATSEAGLRDELLRLAQTSNLTDDIKTVLFHPSFPVDIRHNAKIFREKLALWAEGQVAAQ